MAENILSHVGVDTIGVGFVPIATVHNKEREMQDAFMMVSMRIQCKKQKFELCVADKTLNMRHNIGPFACLRKKTCVIRFSINMIQHGCCCLPLKYGGLQRAIQHDEGNGTVFP